MNIASSVQRYQPSALKPSTAFQPAAQQDLAELQDSIQHQDRFGESMAQSIGEGIFGMIGGGIGAAGGGIAGVVGAAALGSTGWETAAIGVGGIILGGGIGMAVGVYSQR